MGSFYELKRTEMNFQVGAACPIGPFARERFNMVDYNNASLNFDGAKMGIAYALSLNFHIINEYAGVFINFQGHSNAATNGDKVFVGSAENTSLYRKDWQLETVDKWTEFMALAGFTFRYPLVDWLILNARLGIGYAHLITPFYSASVVERNTKFEYNLYSSSEPAMGYTMGLGLKFLLNRSFSIDLRADYMGSTNFVSKDVKSVFYSMDARVENPSDKIELPSAINSFSHKEVFMAVDFSLGFSIYF